MGTTDAIPYIRYIVYYRTNRLKTFGVTLKLNFEKNIPHLSIHSYDEEATEASERINKIKHRSIRACITEGLKEAKRYAFIVFQTNETGIKFIQLRTEGGMYLLDFPLTPQSLNSDHAIEIIKLLYEKGYSQVGSMYRKNSYCIESLTDDMTTIQSNLGNDKKYVTDLCVAIYTKIFKTKIIPEVMFG